MRRRGALAAAAVPLAVILASCSEEAPSTLDPAGSEADTLADVWWILLWMSVGVFALVTAFIVLAIVRGEGLSRITDSSFILVGGFAVPVVILLVVAVITVTTTRELRGEEAPGGVRIEVIGKRWWWEVRYPDEGFVTANEIRVPVGRPIELELRSDNVVHSFWVPQLAGKLDMIPGQTNILRFTVDEAGDYRGICAEYCGLQHARMHFLMIAEDPADFDEWVADHREPPGPPPTPEARRGQEVFLRSACAGCHTVRGTSATGTLGPDLSDFGSRRTIAAVTIPNTPGHLGGWILDPQRIKPGALMPPQFVDGDDLPALIEYLESLR